MSQTIVAYGFGVGDFLDGALASSSTVRGRQSLKPRLSDWGALGDCRQLAAESKQLTGLLTSLKDVVSALSLSTHQQDQLADHVAGCRAVLDGITATL
ncbi:hypothetical protein LTR36_001427 [Oleoguttula mirabilis]|uniref:Uncharacterized protein n=1 Tax=Oleoguttula mirabilis TaxID=1507867 RepID=A0AAV9JQH9_9PEZI|nr:hypothetical protein LTR36_001427 [Oleoguttula mirabilis]